MKPTDDIILSVEGVYKDYQLTNKYNQLLSIKDVFQFRFSDYETTHTVTALQNINLKVRRGEAVGIIGKNGAGKSTLLKIVSGITTPTRGRVIIQGKSLSVLDIGTGFHPDLSGMENVKMISELLGLKRVDLSKRLEKIIAFSEIGDYISKPVKFYSSGMFLRLAFSTVAYLGADIVFLDEVLAVGDLSFQEKCINRIYEMKAEGTSLVFVSHNMNEVNSLCDRTLYLENGKLLQDGTPADVIKKYVLRSSHSASIDTNIEANEHIKNRKEKKKGLNKGSISVDDFNRQIEEDSKIGIGQNAFMRLTQMVTTDESDHPKDTFSRQDNIYITFSYEILQADKNIVLGLVINDITNTRLLGVHTIKAESKYRNTPGVYTGRCVIKKEILSIGSFSIELLTASNMQMLGRFTQCAIFEIQGVLTELGSYQFRLPIDIDMELKLYPA